ncbi:cytochrome P450 monooxygenase [Xylogone sp. PMI_703]|nr:cytochrome P450 monooxygenase [Xylogone sp. PMI_703]
MVGGTRIVVLLLLGTAAVTYVLCAVARRHLPEYPFKLVFVGLIASQSLLWVIYTIEIYPHFISPLRHLPSPKGGYPLIGHGLAQFKKPLGEEFLRFQRDVPNNGIIHFKGFFNSDNLFLTSPRTLADVLVAKTYHFEKPEKSRGFLRRVLGDGLVVVEGDLHKHQRKHILPSFSFRHIKELYPAFWRKSLSLIEYISAEVLENSAQVTSEGVPFGVTDINEWSPKVTLDLIGIAGLGRDFNTIKNSDDELVKLYEEILDPTLEKRALFVAQSIGPIWLRKILLHGPDRRFSETTRRLRELCTSFVREKRELIKVESDHSVDLLSKLIESNSFSDQELVDQLLTFLAAGHETTSSTFTWATYLLAKYPSVQSRLRDEIRAHVPEEAFTGTDFDSATTLESMPLLNAVCNETLRVYPTVPLTSRVANRNTTILGQHVLKGTTIFLAPWATNRSQDLWGPDAEEFMPERWINEDTGTPNNTGGAKSNYSILTFLHGPRSCIGQGFAKAELRALIAVFVDAFEIELANPLEVPRPAGLITTKPRDGMNLKLKSAKR